MNATTYLEAVVHLVVPTGTDPQEVFVDLADAFHELPERTVRDIAFDATSNEVTMCFTFDGRVDPQEAIRRATSAGRTAFHAAGLGTGDGSWDLARWNIVPSQPRVAEPA